MCRIYLYKNKTAGRYGKRDVLVLLEEHPLNALEVAEILHIGKNKVYELARDGELASYHIGRKLRFTLRDVEAYVRAQRSGPNAPTVSPAEQSGIHEALALLAPDGDAPARRFVLAGSDIACDLLANRLANDGVHVERRYTSEFSALVSLYVGKADLAVVNLYDMRTNRYNVPYVQRLAPGTPVVVIRLASRKVGFIVKAGNPKIITTWGSLLRGDVRMLNRPKGTGERILLDEKVIAMEAHPDSIAGYEREAASPRELAVRIANGEGDVGIGFERSVRNMPAVGFVPLQTEDIDVVVLKNGETRPLVRRVKALLASGDLADVFDGMGEYGTDKTGVILYES